MHWFSSKVDRLRFGQNKKTVDDKMDDYQKAFELKTLLWLLSLLLDPR